LYVYLFVHPASGRSYFLILPSLSAEIMGLALRKFAQDFNPKQGDQGKIIEMMLGNVGSHTAKHGLVLLHLPAHPLNSPQLSW
jgi:uncharacterized membrane protein YeaQ/YmgE (transglycosylase-associated protein family)